MDGKRLSQRIQALGTDLGERLPGKFALEGSEKLRPMFEACFGSTACTTVRVDAEGSPFVITGDIPAMWLRDSAAQVRHYLRFMRQEPVVAEFVRGLVLRHFVCIGIDAYANAFNQSASGQAYDAHDHTESSPWVWERKYEVDSLCASLHLLYQYWRETGDATVLTPQVLEGIERILALWRIEQRHENSPYSFERDDCRASDTLPMKGRGTPVAFTGMTWSGFRPSDDACQYGYLVPSNMYAHTVLGFVAEMLPHSALARDAAALREEIGRGIERYGIVEHPQFGRMYAYEVDGLGNANLMDDANVPSLLSIPYFGYAYDAEVYENTRAFVLSHSNPYFFEGSCARGIGSPHTDPEYVWPIAFSMRGLTSRDAQEKLEALRTLLTTDAGTGLMHESFHVDDPARFTREWFAWANSVFAEFVIHLLDTGVL